MKPLLVPIALSASLGGVVCGVAAKTKRKPAGKCEPYAEVCRHCSDCSQCKHCAKDGGKCSVCWKR